MMRVSDIFLRMVMMSRPDFCSSATLQLSVQVERLIVEVSSISSLSQVSEGNEFFDLRITSKLQVDA